MTNHIIRVDGKEYDLTQNERPVCFLPMEVKEAMETWPHGHRRAHSASESGDVVLWENVVLASNWCTRNPFAIYRCKPAPQVTRHESWWREGYPAQDRQWSHHTHRIIIEYPGDTLPDGDYLGPEGARFIVEELK